MAGMGGSAHGAPPDRLEGSSKARAGVMSPTDRLEASVSPGRSDRSTTPGSANGYQDSPVPTRPRRNTNTSARGSMLFKSLLVPADRTNSKQDPGTPVPAVDDPAQTIALGTIELEVTGLTPEQIETLEVVKEKIASTVAQYDRVVKMYDESLADNRSINTLLAEKESLIQMLRAGEADDVRSYKDKQSEAYKRMDKRVRDLSEQLESAETERIMLENYKSSFTQKCTLLTLKLEEMS
eukprot:gene11254-17315_t